MTRHNDTIYLRHMLEHAVEAQSHAIGKSVEDVRNSRVLQLALFHLVEIMGEAASRVSIETRNRYPEIPWRGVIGMRNRIVHGYEVLDVDVLWDTLNEDVPPLIVQLSAILGREE